MKIEFISPKLSLGQKAGTTLLCSCASALFLVPPALASWAEVAPQMWAGGLLGPWAFATAFWMVKDVVDANDAKNKHADGAEGEARVRAAEAQAVREQPRVGVR